MFAGKGAITTRRGKGIGFAGAVHRVAQVSNGMIRARYTFWLMSKYKNITKINLNSKKFIHKIIYKTL